MSPSASTQSPATNSSRAAERAREYRSVYCPSLGTFLAVRPRETRAFDLHWSRPRQTAQRRRSRAAGTAPERLWQRQHCFPRLVLSLQLPKLHDKTITRIAGQQKRSVSEPVNKPSNVAPDGGLIRPVKGSPCPRAEGNWCVGKRISATGRVDDHRGQDLICQR